MKKYYLPALAFIFLVGLLVVGGLVWFGLGRRQKRLSVLPSSQPSLHTPSTQSDNNQPPAWLKRYLTPGVVTRRVLGEDQVSLVNGYFKGLERIPGSEDKYLIVVVKETQLPKLRLLAQPRPSRKIKFATEVSLLRLRHSHNLTEAVHTLGKWSELDPETKQMFSTPNQWLSALVYTDNLGRPLKDKSGALFVRALTVKGDQ